MNNTSMAEAVARVPPHAFFMVSAVFHYLGPSFAVLLFAHAGVLGVAWLRIASAALVFMIWQRPWRTLWRADGCSRRLILALGVTLALMNSTFYLAIDRLPLATVASIEFISPIAIALAGAGSPRNLLALMMAVSGALILTGIDWSADWLGFSFAIANAVLFGAYILLGHALSRAGAVGSIDRLGAAMSVALIVAFPIGIGEALPVLSSPTLLAAAVGVGLCSSVVPYICDQLAMARLPRATFALMLTLLPATAAIVGALVLAQVPGPLDIAGMVLVMAGVAIHRPPQES